jgi:hypothetical protein
MKKYNLILISFCLFSFVTVNSCKVEVDKTIEGWWTMDTIYYKNQDIKHCLIGNSLQFEANKQIIIPNADCAPIVIQGSDKFGNWEIIKSENSRDTIPYRMKILTMNEVFSGTHKIVFYKDNVNKLLKMEIFSDNLYIVCRKGLYNFDKNIKTIDELEKITWTNRP